MCLLCSMILACCIDKSSSAELSEAINSMFAWYRNARVCYVYLEHVAYNDYHVRQPDARLQILENAKWFIRGWTLQELLAPLNVIFYGREWAQNSDHVRVVNNPFSNWRQSIPWYHTLSNYGYRCCYIERQSTNESRKCRTANVMGIRPIHYKTGGPSVLPHGYFRC